MRTTAMILTFAICASLAGAQTVPTGFVVDTILSTGLDAPHGLAVDSLGRLFICERGGEIHVVVGGVATSIGTVPNIETGSERGLLAVAPGPQFSTNGELFVWGSRTTSPNLELLRYTCTGQLSNPASGAITFAASSERVVLDSASDISPAHNGGTLLFSPVDGMLLLSLGDDDICSKAQDTNDLSGSILRMDVSGLPAGPSATAPSFAALDPGDNPASGSNSPNALIMDIGLRNPWRMTQDILTGDLYIADVGDSMVEEFNVREYANPGQGVNFGWPYLEGTMTGNFCPGFGVPISGLTDPVIEVTHAAGWFSAFGGFFYRHLASSSQSFGPAYDRVWFYGDYFSGELRALADDGNGNFSPLPPAPGQPSPANWGIGFDRITQCVQHPDGTVYFTQHDNGFSGGFLKRIRSLGSLDVVALQSGGGQVGLASEVFLDPVTVRVSDSLSGLPLPGVAVTFSVTNGSIVGGSSVATDANGMASVFVQAGGAGGVVDVTATTSNMGSVTASLFARGLSVTFVAVSGAEIITTAFENQSALAQVPLLFALSLDTFPAIATPLGNFCVDLFGGVDTIIFEDAFSGLSSNVVPPFGTPGRFANYFAAPGSIPAGTYRFQYVWDDPTTFNSVQGQLPFRVGISNCATISVP